MQTLFVGIGTLILICAHVALGSITALMNKEWNWDTFWRGIIKGAIVTVALAAVWFVGWLNSDIVVVEIDGQQVNLTIAVYGILFTAFIYYARKVLLQLKDTILNKKEIDKDDQQK